MKILSLLFVSILFSGASAVADKHHHHHKKKHDHKKRHHKAHSHGVGKLNLVTSGQELEIEIEVPGHDILGFEHKPKTTAQKKSVKSAIVFLKNTAGNIELNKDSGCVAKAKAIVKTPLESDYHGHAHDHHKKHDDEEHSEFHITYKFRCADMSKLTFVKVLSFRQFKNMKKLKAQGLTDAGQFSQTLTAKSSQFDLTK